MNGDTEAPRWPKPILALNGLRTAIRLDPALHARSINLQTHPDTRWRPRRLRRLGSVLAAKPPTSVPYGDAGAAPLQSGEQRRMTATPIGVPYAEAGL